MWPSDAEAQLYMVIAIALGVLLIATIALLATEMARHDRTSETLGKLRERLHDTAADRDDCVAQVEALRNRIRFMTERSDRSLDQHFDTVPTARHRSPVTIGGYRTGETLIIPAPVVAQVVGDKEPTQPIAARDTWGEATT